MYEARLDPSTPLGIEVIGGPACSGHDLMDGLLDCWVNIANAIPGCAACAAAASPCLLVCSGGLITSPACWTCIGLAGRICLGTVGPGGQPGGCLKALYDLFTKDCNKAASNLNSCFSYVLRTIGPIDPNEKLVIAEKYIQPDQLLVYPIHFENVGDIEALDVFVTDVLDTNLDVSTVELLTPDGASFDENTRTVKWDLLGRNLQPGETGNVLLSVKPLPNLPSGTEIRNAAAIQFEVFDIFITNEVVNIIDTTLPNGVMDALPAETKTVDFQISWSGTDAVGEIDYYSIFVSVDGEGFKPYLERTQETSATFSGEDGRTYEFLCVAVDTAGNIEVQDAVSEAVTFINIDQDGDGILDDDDMCPNSDLSPIVVIGGCDTGVNNLFVNNLLDVNGCTIADQIDECAEGASNHGDFVSCVANLTNNLKKAGIITGQEKGKIQSCAAQADIP